MKALLRDAVRRFLRLYDERAEGWDDEGHQSITEELERVATEIRILLKNMAL